MTDFHVHWLNILKKTGMAFKSALIQEKVDIRAIFNMKQACEVVDFISKYNMSSAKLKDIETFAFEAVDVEIKNKAKKTYDDIIRKHIKTVSYTEKNYPDRLRRIYAPPVLLYFIGEIPDEDTISTAVVGSRNATKEGLNAAYSFSEFISKRNIHIISGMAIGIDGMAHKGALAAGGKTFAVLGSGVDVPYPKSNIDIYESIKERGGIISEFPPGEQPSPINFPRRNRIIAGLSDKVLLIEAGIKSGSLITADLALEQGKDIYALPGRPEDVNKMGCNELIKKGGASLITSPEDMFLY